MFNYYLIILIIYIMRLYLTGNRYRFIPHGKNKSIYIRSRKQNGAGLLLSYKLGAGLKAIENAKIEKPPDMSSLNDKLANLHISNKPSRKKKFVNFSV